MAEARSEFVNGLGEEVQTLSDEELFARMREHMERRGRTTAPAVTAATTESARAPSTRFGIFMPSTVPELRGRGNLAAFLQRFRTWACVARIDYSLDTEVAVKTPGIPRAELEKIHDPNLVDDSLQAWQALTKALEKEEQLSKMVLDIGSLSEAWRALTRIAADSYDDACDNAKQEFETFEITANESVTEYFARVQLILMKLEKHKIVVSARGIKRAVLGSLNSRFPNETDAYAMQNFELSDLETRLVRLEKFRADREKRGAPAHALAAAHAGSGRTVAGGGARGRGRQGRRSGKRQDDGHNQQQGQPQQSPPGQPQPQQAPGPHQHLPPPWQQQQPQQSSTWRQQQQQQRRQPLQPHAWQQQRWQPQQSPAWQQQQRWEPPGPWSSWERPPPQQQNPWAAWERPPPQQQYRSGRSHPRRHHRGGDQPHWQRALCQWCGEEKHFPANCRTAASRTVRQHHPNAASSFSGAYAAQHDTSPPPSWTSHDSYASAPPMPSPPGSVGPTTRTTPPSAPPSESDWNFSSGQSRALQAHYVPPGEFSSLDQTDWRFEDYGVDGSYLPSAFVGQPVGVDQVNDVWIDDSGATTQMTRNADLMYDTRPPSPNRSRIILGDGSIKKVLFVGKIDLVFHSRTNHLVTLHDVSYVPDLGFNLFSFHVVQEKHEIILNKTGAHLLGGRLVFPRRSNGSSLRATRVLPGGHENTALATFADPPSHRSDGPPSPVPYSNGTSPVAHHKSGVSRLCRTSNAEARSGIKIRESESALSGNVGTAAAVLSPGDVFFNKNQKKVIDINHFHVSLAHARSSVLKATALQHDIKLVGELVPCSGCSMAKGIRASTPHHTTSRAATPLDMVHIDTAGPFPESLGGLRYVVMFVDSASRLQRPYGTRDKTAASILGVVQRFIADMGVLRAVRTDNGTEYTNSTFVEYCNSLRIRHELTAPYTPQQNGPVESGLSRAIKAGHAARLEVNKLFPNVHLERLKGVRDPDGSSLWMESVLWASDGFNRSATTANSGMHSPHEVFFGSRPPMPVLPFCKPAYHRVPRQGKLDRKARPCYFSNFGYNHGSDCMKIMDAETGRIVHSRDVTWHQPREPLISPAPTVGSEVPQSPSGTPTPDYIHIQPTPAATTAPTAAPLPAYNNAAPTPLPNSAAQILDRVVRELVHEGGVRMPGRTRGETRAMRESPHSMGLMSHAALAQGLATRAAFDEAFHEHELPPPDADLPTAPASDVPTPSTVAEAES